MADQVFRLISKYDQNNVLTVKNNAAYPGATVQVWTNINDLSSAWFMDTQGCVHNLANSDLCLATVGADQQSGPDRFRDVQVLPQPNAGKWQIRKTEDPGGVRLLADSSDLFLACWGSTATVVAQSASPGNDMLNWLIRYLN